MKKYHLFTFNRNHPNGGIRDYVDSFDSIDEARASHDPELSGQIAVQDSFGILKAVLEYDQPPWYGHPKTEWKKTVKDAITPPT